MDKKDSMWQRWAANTSCIAVALYSHSAVFKYSILCMDIIPSTSARDRAMADVYA